MAAAGWPAALVAALQRSLAPDPAQRYPSPAAWHRAVALASPPAAAAGRTTTVRRRSGVVTATALGLAVLVGAGGALAASAVLDDGDETDVEQLGDDRVRVSTAEDDAEIAVVGPSRASVDETVRFAAETSGVDTWLWVTSDGPRVETEELSVTPQSPGTAAIRLVGITSDGDVLEVTHEFPVDP